MVYALLIASLMVYFVGAAVYWRRAFVSLRDKPYNQMRMAHQHLRLSVRVCRLATARSLLKHSNPHCMLSPR